MNKVSLLSTPKAAQYLGLSSYYLRNLRQGLHPDPGPPYHKMIDHKRRWVCMYSRAGLDHWNSTRVQRQDRRPGHRRVDLLAHNEYLLLSLTRTKQFLNKIKRNPPTTKSGVQEIVEEITTLLNDLVQDKPVVDKSPKETK